MSKHTSSSSSQNVRVDVLAVPRQVHGGPYIQNPQHLGVAGRGAAYSPNSDLVYVNAAFVGSVDNVNANRVYERPTTVILEQYWACSKWTFAQRLLALAVGVLLGAVISLTLVITLNNNNVSMSDVFRFHQ